MPLVFGLDAALSEDERRLSTTLIQYWTAFAANGRPAATSPLPEWSAYSAATDASLRIIDLTSSTMATGLKKELCDFWDAFSGYNSSQLAP